MTHSEMVQRRLYNQRLAGPPFEAVTEVVRWLGAVQAQDVTGAKWALGLRARGVTDADVDRAFDEGAILRTHVLRPTWHFVLPEDIRWLLALTGPRVHQQNGTMYRREGLDDAFLKRCHAVMVKALEGNRYLTRDELAEALSRSGIEAERGLRLTHIVMHAELEGILCSGPKRGKQFTYALLDERAPQVRTLTREEALAELTGRFFASRGPATEYDFSKWSGLTVGDARTGIEMLGSELTREEIDGASYWWTPAALPDLTLAPAAHWLPNYDEYVSSYADLGALLDPQIDPGWNPIASRTYPHLMVRDGQIVGLWRRVIEKDSTRIEPHPLVDLSDAAQLDFAEAAARYADFLGTPVIVE